MFYCPIQTSPLPKHLMIKDGCRRPKGMEHKGKPRGVTSVSGEGLRICILHLIPACRRSIWYLTPVPPLCHPCAAPVPPQKKHCRRPSYPVSYRWRGACLKEIYNIKQFSKLPRRWRFSVCVAIRQGGIHSSHPRFLESMGFEYKFV